MSSYEYPFRAARLPQSSQRCRCCSPRSGDAEREALARLVDELEALEPLIVEASRAADPDARIRFQCDWLGEDLAIVRRGVEAHLETPRAEPRPVPALRADYRR